jgi:hypothetical protein
MLKKINYIFSLEGIFDFLHSRFDTVRIKFDRNGMKGKKSLEQWHLWELNFINGL